MSIHQKAVDILKASKISLIKKQELYELYMEEVEDTSVAFALEKLSQDITNEENKLEKA